MGKYDYKFLLWCYPIIGALIGLVFALSNNVKVEYIGILTMLGIITGYLGYIARILCNNKINK